MHTDGNLQEPHVQFLSMLKLKNDLNFIGHGGGVACVTRLLNIARSALQMSSKNHGKLWTTVTFDTVLKFSN